jgi:glycerol-3-phosphate dehydrogenase
MKRNIDAVANKAFDLAIIGGGIFGACAAWDAALRGLNVVLVEKGDFCQATSANHFKMVHGGIRYLQHLDIKRVRESSRERSALLRVAPHLVKPLPIIVPTYGYGLKSKPVLAVGLKMYDAITYDRNNGIDDRDRMVPSSRTMSRKDVLDLFPELPAQGLTGAGIFADGQMLNPPRLVLAFIRSAVENGADAVNYLEAKQIIVQDRRVTGIEVEDRLTGHTFPIHSRVVLNTAGPWSEKLLDKHTQLSFKTQQTFSRDACFIIKKQLSRTYGLAVPGETSDPDAILSREKRHLFIAPWKEYSLIGVWHVVYDGDPDRISVPRQDLDEFISEINAAYPQLNLAVGDVVRWNAGLTLFGENKPGAKNLSYGKRSVLCDHAAENHIQGLITLIGVRATTARGMAEKAVNLALEKLGKNGPVSKTENTPVIGGDIGEYKTHVRTTRQNCAAWLDPESADALSRNYGSEVSKIMAYRKEESSLGEKIGSSCVIKAEVVHAVREEMAQNLADVVYRRTDLASGAYPGDDALKICADIMGKEMGWNTERRAAEVLATKNLFQGVEP